MSFEKDVLSLISSYNFQRLATYKPPFDPFSVVIRNLHEDSYSNVLKWLLGDPVNEEFKRKFLERVFCQDGEIEPKLMDERPIVEREFNAGSIDVFFNHLKL